MIPDTATLAFSPGPNIETRVLYNKELLRKETYTFLAGKKKPLTHFALEIGILYFTLHHYLNGKGKSIPFKKIEAIAKGINQPVEKFFEI